MPVFFVLPTGQSSTNIPHEPGHFAIEIKYKFSYFYTFAYIFNTSRHPVISNLTYSATICSIS